ncbi:hypothetical protein [Mesorhizobium sp. L2C067A000]|uniref:hypothetical protein n=1 Tax=Mesorhizobium sp. L2C067A000 TaxID=1287106 RepID=UPI0003CFC95A|nr:hypothetical protein [Mesorhizobium sp. L2C067A000]ESZ29619.1 hypothetical protein X733_24925 [Mesorhizobium sp. L2C067A000]
MPTPAEIRLIYLTGQLAHNQSIVSKQDIVVGLLNHEGSPTTDAIILLASMHHTLQGTRQSLHEAEAAYRVRNAE